MHLAVVLGNHERCKYWSYVTVPLLLKRYLDKLDRLVIELGVSQPETPPSVEMCVGRS
jgi:hypothetical protein